MISLDPTPLTQTETRHLVQAADQPDGLLILPEHLKPATRERLIGKFMRVGLVTRHQIDDKVTHRLNPAGYRAVERKPPRSKRSVAATTAAPASNAILVGSASAITPPTDVPVSAICTTEVMPNALASDASGIANGAGIEALPVTKRTLFLDLLARETGASLAEIVAATGWLPHTSRAALSRLRSAGQPLSKAKRADGCTAYRLVQAETIAGKKRRMGRAEETKCSSAAAPPFSAVAGIV